MDVKGVEKIKFYASKQRTIVVHCVDGLYRVAKRGMLLPLNEIPTDDEYLILCTVMLNDVGRLSYVATDGDEWWPVDFTTRGSYVAKGLWIGPKYHSAIIRKLTTTDKKAILRCITRYISDMTE